MSFGVPGALLLLLPVAAAGVLFRRSDGFIGVLLPGQWRRVVEPRLRRFMAGSISGRRWGQLALCLVTLAILTLALARPHLDSVNQPDFGNLSGRVLVLDASGSAALGQQRLFAQSLIETSSDTPTALVAVAGDAFDVVPLTTDQRYLQRYLQVIGPGLMPAPGRAIELGLAHAGSILSDAGVVAGQVVLVTGGEPIAAGTTALPDKVVRTVVVPNSELAAWREYATGSGARLAGTDEIDRVIAWLDEATDRHGWDRLRAARLDLTPSLIGVAMVLWLGLFRRRVMP